MVRKNEKPDCFDSQEQYDSWLAALDLAGNVRLSRDCNYCADCTEEFALRMREEGRCEYPRQGFRNGVAVPRRGRSEPGVYKYNDTKWVAWMTVGGKKVHIGYYKTEAEASSAREAYSLRGIAYVTDATQSSGNAKAGLQPGGDNGVSPQNREAECEERSFRVLRPYMPGTRGSLRSPDDKQRQSERAHKEDHGTPEHASCA